MEIAHHVNVRISRSRNPIHAVQTSATISKIKPILAIHAVTYDSLASNLTLKGHHFHIS